MGSARWRLACLEWSQAAHALALGCLGAWVFRSEEAAGSAHAALQVLALLLAPALFLAPLAGAVCNRLPRRWVLVTTAGAAAAAVLLCHAGGVSWLVGWALAAICAIGYRTAAGALLPAAAREARVPLPQDNALLLGVRVGAACVGIALGLDSRQDGFAGPFPKAVGAGVLGYLVSLLAAGAARFDGDGRRAEAPAAARAGFLRDARGVWKCREARPLLLALAGFSGLAGVLLGIALASWPDTGLPPRAPGVWVRPAVWCGIGLMAGSALASLQGNPWRCPGLVPFGALGLFACLLAAAAGGLLSDGLALAVGIMGGLVAAPLASAYQANLPPEARGNGTALLNLVGAAGLAVGAGALLLAAGGQVLTPAGQLWLAAGLAGAAAALSAWAFLRQALEQLTEVLLGPFYRVRARGPGLEQFPMRGPVLVVANHSAWFDPMWLAKVLPRRVMVMMTSLFYDLPGLHWLMKHVVRAIRVPAATFRREAPELKEAVALLDRGECLLVFPEGAMRKRDEQPLKHFGQGVWHILHERPQTPVVVCWIEGGWGSYTSYRKGPPTRNKRLDFWRPIDVAVGPPEVLDPALLEDQRATRTYLMRACLEARRYLGLEPLRLEADGEEPEAADDDKGGPGTEPTG